MHNTRLIGFALTLTVALVAGAGAATPETVRFTSADGRTELVAYLFKPAAEGPFPAIVMLHGRGGPYSSTTGRTIRTTIRERRNRAMHPTAPRCRTASNVPTRFSRGI